MPIRIAWLSCCKACYISFLRIFNIYEKYKTNFTFVLEYRFSHLRNSKSKAYCALLLFFTNKNYCFSLLKILKIECNILKEKTLMKYIYFQFTWNKSLFQSISVLLVGPAVRLISLPFAHNLKKNVTHFTQSRFSKYFISSSKTKQVYIDFYLRSISKCFFLRCKRFYYFIFKIR